MKATLAMAMGVPVGLVGWAGIDCDEAGGRRTGRGSVHQRHIGRASWARRGGRRAGGGTTVENGLFAALEAVVELSGTSGNWEGKVS